MMNQSLDRAMKEDVIFDDVKDCAASGWITTGLATYRGVGRCTDCTMPVLICIQAVWNKQVPTMLSATVSGEQCPDCGAVLSPSTVIYRGIYSPGCPFIPETPISVADLSYALSLMEQGQCEAEQTNSSSADSLRRKREANSEVSTKKKHLAACSLRTA